MLELGGLYHTTWERRKLRIIGLDEFEVLYDTLWEDGEWAISADLNRNNAYARSDYDHFLASAEYVGHQPLTAKELVYFRPDLPIRIGRIREFNWNSTPAGDKVAFEKAVAGLLKEDHGKKLDCPRIMLIPIGVNARAIRDPDGGISIVELTRWGKMGRGVVKECAGEFDLLDLLWEAKCVQEQYADPAQRGIGLYRLGNHRSTPSYYIGGYIDLAEVMKG